MYTYIIYMHILCIHVHTYTHTYIYHAHITFNIPYLTTGSTQSLGEDGRLPNALMPCLTES